MKRILVDSSRRRDTSVPAKARTNGQMLKPRQKDVMRINFIGCFNHLAVVTDRQTSQVDT